MNKDIIETMRVQLLSHYKRTMDPYVEKKIGIDRRSFIDFLNAKKPPRFGTCLKIQRYLESLPAENA